MTLAQRDKVRESGVQQQEKLVFIVGKAARGGDAKSGRALRGGDSEETTPL